MIAPVIDLGPLKVDLRNERWVDQGMRMSIAGTSGSGKSYLTSKLMEELHRIGVPFLCIDPDSEYRSLAQLERVKVCGNREGYDIPLTGNWVGAVINEVLVEKNSVVVDLGGRDDAEIRMMYTPLAKALFQAQSKNREAGTLMSMFFIVDEVHIFAPEKRQSEAADSLGVTLQIARRGRKYGIHVIYPSQRPGDLIKDVLSQMNCRFIGYLEEANDFKAVKSILPAGFKHSDLKALESGIFYFSVGKDFHLLPRCSPRITKNLGKTPPIVGVQHVQSMMFVEVPE